MGLEKSIEHGQDYREPYTGAKAIDKSCRNHGSCGWCYDNRNYRTKRLEEKMKWEEEEYEENNY